MVFADLCVAHVAEHAEFGKEMGVGEREFGVRLEWAIGKVLEEGVVWFGVEELRKGQLGGRGVSRDVAGCKKQKVNHASPAVGPEFGKKVFRCYRLHNFEGQSFLGKRRFVGGRARARTLFSKGRRSR